MILFNPETALKLSRNIGKKNQCDSNYLFDEEEARTSWDYVATFGDRSPRRGMSQCGSDEVTEPVYRLAYLRLDAPTHLASYQRST